MKHQSYATRWVLTIHNRIGRTQFGPLAERPFYYLGVERGISTGSTPTVKLSPKRISEVGPLTCRSRCNAFGYWSAAKWRREGGPQPARGHWNRCVTLASPAGAEWFAHEHFAYYLRRRR